MEKVKSPTLERLLTVAVHTTTTAARSVRLVVAFSSSAQTGCCKTYHPTALDAFRRDAEM